MPRIRKEYLDIDYLNQLNPEEKEWLNKFMNETLNASFNKDNEANLIKDKAQQKKIYNENNARNRCIYSIAKARGLVSDGETSNHREDSDLNHNAEEDVFIDSVQDSLDEGYYYQEFYEGDEEN